MKKQTKRAIFSKIEPDRRINTIINGPADISAKLK
jgi:hypothetical protein